MQFRAAVAWLLLLTVGTWRVGNHETGCSFQLIYELYQVVFTCSNLNSTKELDINLNQVATENNIPLKFVTFLNLTNINNFIPNALSAFPKLKKLTFVSSNISLPSQAFSEFSRLKSIGFVDVELEIFENTFHGLNLSQLFMVRVNGNYLPVLWQNGLTSLTLLQLNYNSLEKIDNNIFKSLNQLKHLRLHDNNITEVSSGSFQNLNRLMDLMLQSNTISMLPTGLFNGLHNLWRLNVAYNVIEGLEPGIFQDLKKLKYLDLSHNSIRILEQSHFQGLDNLLRLEVNNNKISALSTDLFKHLSRIGLIRLQYNSVKDVELGAFRGLKDLELLDLFDNEIETFPADAFGGNDALTCIDLSNNKIQSLFNNNCENINNKSGILLNCTNFDGLATLKSLDLENNIIHNLPIEELNVFPKLQYIKLNGNMLGSDEIQEIYNKYGDVYDCTNNIFLTDDYL